MVDEADQLVTDRLPGAAKDPAFRTKQDRHGRDRADNRRRCGDDRDSQTGPARGQSYFEGPLKAI